jgi:hypothetical protein
MESRLPNHDLLPHSEEGTKVRTPIAVLGRGEELTTWRDRTSTVSHFDIKV